MQWLANMQQRKLNAPPERGTANARKLQTQLQHLLFIIIFNGTSWVCIHMFFCMYVYRNWSMLRFSGTCNMSTYEMNLYSWHSARHTVAQYIHIYVFLCIYMIYWMKDICKVEATALHYKCRRTIHATLTTGQPLSSYIINTYTYAYILCMYMCVCMSALVQWQFDFRYAITLSANDQARSRTITHWMKWKSQMKLKMRCKNQCEQVAEEAYCL